MTHRIFISAAPQDEAHARHLCAALESAGLACWLTARDLDPHRNRIEAIFHAVLDADAAVCVVTQAANDAPQVCREIELAADRQRMVAAARFDDTAPSGTLRHHLGQARSFDIFGADADAALARLADYLRQAKAP